MAEELRVSIALVGAVLIAMALTPLATRTAVAAGLVDEPTGYKAHAQATPHLGGLAVLVTFALVAIVAADGLGDHAAMLGAVVVLFVVGTLDDRFGLGITVRLLAQLAAGLILWAEGTIWEPTGVGPIDGAVSVLWVIGVANAFNLLDNIDGAAGATAATCAAGIGVLALSEDATMLGALAFALCGACIGFLRYNLARPSQIFLGDAGSVPIGFLLAAMAMMVPAGAAGPASLLAGVPIVGVALFDTCLVVVSRLRRGAPVLTGARDHLTHRLLGVLPGPRGVAALLAGVQALLCALGILLWSVPAGWAAAIAIGYACTGIALVVRLETPPFRPARPAEQPA